MTDIKKYNDLMSNGKEITDDDLKKLVEEWVIYEQVEIKKDINREQFKEKVSKYKKDNKETMEILEAQLKASQW